MYKNFSLTDQERKQILEQHKGKGYRQPLKESTLENAVDEIGLTPDEIDALTSSLIDMGKTDFKYKVADIASGESSDDMSSEMMEGGEMSDKEFKLRSAIDKIINKVGVISTLGIVPAAMFAGGGAGVAAGVTALTMLLLKDAAWWKKGHEMHKEMGDARKSTENMGVGDYLMGKEREVDENLGEGGFWKNIFGEPDVKDAARSAYKSQGHSMMGSDDEKRKGEYYMVFNGEKFFPDQIDYADYNDLGDLPRVENGMLIVPNPAWQS